MTKMTGKDFFPDYRGKMEYVCLDCGARYPGDELLYSCPKCDSVLLLENTDFRNLAKCRTGQEWQALFDQRQCSRIPALRGIFRFYELLAPVFAEEDIVWLGEGATPMVEAALRFEKEIGIRFAFKNEGQNPSASFKDRGMACAFSYLKWLCRRHEWDEVLTICASTGDTSAAAALYSAYVGPPLKSVVLLPRGKVTPQQLSQPLASGAFVIELPGVFDDCMKVVENLARRYRVALLNSKNSWRILGQESYAYEVAQWRGWDMDDLAIFVPIGNAGNITAIMSGFLKLQDLGIIDKLPRMFGVQSNHADPVYRYYAEPENKRVWKPVEVRPSVAQAAMIGNPVSFPRVRKLAALYVERAGAEAFNVIHVREQAIMDAMAQANRHGHIACTQGAECLAGLAVALKDGLIHEQEYAVLDSTAHALKFSGFLNQYFDGTLSPEYEIVPQKELANHPECLLADLDRNSISLEEFVSLGAEAVAMRLDLREK